MQLLIDQGIIKAEDVQGQNQANDQTTEDTATQETTE